MGSSQDAYNKGLAREREARLRNDGAGGATVGGYESSGVSQTFKGDEEALWIKEPTFSTDRLLLGRNFFGVDTDTLTKPPPTAIGTYYRFPQIECQNIRYLRFYFLLFAKPSTSQYSYTLGTDLPGIPFTLGQTSLGTPAAVTISNFLADSYPVRMTEYRTPVIAANQRLFFTQDFDVSSYPVVTLAMADLIAAAGDPDKGLVWVYYSFGS